MVGSLVSAFMKSLSIPRATYRLQFNRNFTFRQATELVPYLAALGISHCYSSPYLRARPGSTHGYDIIDHNSLNPEIGTPEEFDQFVDALHQHGMGQILDIVPNHMGIMGSDNAWWLDVLENGQASSYAEFFDIDWEPLKEELRGKVLIPVLGDQYGAILDRGELELKFDREKGEFSIFYFQHRFPINPNEYPRILGLQLERLEQRLGAQNEDLLELQSLITALNHLPSRHEASSERRAERVRDKEIHKRRLAALCLRSPEVTEFVEENVSRMNGVPGNPESFENLHELIKTQSYRLAYWRVAADDINYRRFFDINDLAGLRQENEAVFEQTHRFILELVKQGKVNGLRVDHPDGLYDPEQYFHRLQCGKDCPADKAQCDGKPLFVVAEKILTADERLPENWPVHGTTGYEFANLLNGLFVDPAAKMSMDRIYRGFIGDQIDFDEAVYDCKKLVMDRALASELNVLANNLSRIALANRHTCDFTVKGLRDALMEVAACFPVYRTYVSGKGVSETDRRYIEEAVDCAKSKSTSADPSAYDFMREVLLTRQAEACRESYRRAVLRFAMKFQQFTSALMAKGIEDTGFYRYFRLTSLNEVGGDPRRFGVTTAEFHHANLERSKHWPHSLLTTSTHDTKRSEDVRARINALSEIPVLWRRQVRRWRELNREKKRHVDGMEMPTRNDEYLFYQTLIGAWPSGDEARLGFGQRMREYMLKAVREAKDRTSWANPNEEYEAALTEFVETALKDEEFLADFVPFQRDVARFGTMNSLSQTLLKLTVPGVPDIYQGNELWDFSLVDPDNRRAVDYARREQALQQLQDLQPSDTPQSELQSFVNCMSDGRIKLYLISRTLALRKEHPELFERGEYLPLNVVGDKTKHLVAFARRTEKLSAIIAVPRLCAQLVSQGAALPIGPDVWGNTKIEIPGALTSAGYRNALTGELLKAERQPDGSSIAASAVLSSFPVGLFVSETHPSQGLARLHGTVYPEKSLARQHGFHGVHKIPCSVTLAYSSPDAALRKGADQFW